jgi:CheY-like chemotaxis protein
MRSGPGRTGRVRASLRCSRPSPFGYSSDAGLYHDFARFYVTAEPDAPPQADARQALDRARAGAACEAEGWLRRRDGSRFRALIRTSALWNGASQLQGYVVEEMVHLLRASISAKAMVRYDPDPGLPGIEADVSQIQQLIMNLVINASEALEGGEGIRLILMDLTMPRMGGEESYREPRFTPAFNLPGRSLRRPDPRHPAGRRADRTGAQGRIRPARTGAHQLRAGPARPVRFRSVACATDRKRKPSPWSRRPCSTFHEKGVEQGPCVGVVIPSVAASSRQRTGSDEQGDGSGHECF